MLPWSCRALFAAFLIALAGCGGASTSTPATGEPLPATPASSGVKTTAVTLTLVRSGAAHTATPKYLPFSAARASIAFTQGSMIVPNSVNLTGCAPSCTVTVNAPLGPNVNAAATVYTSANVPLATGSLSNQTIAASGTTLTFTLGAIVKSLTLSIPQNVTVNGGVQQYAVNPTMLDATGAMIPVGTPLANGVAITSLANAKFGATSCTTPQNTLSLGSAVSFFLVCGQISGVGAGSFQATPGAFSGVTTTPATGSFTNIANHHLYLSGGAGTIACDGLTGCIASGTNTGLNGNYSGVAGNVPLTTMSSGGTPGGGNGGIGVAAALTAGQSNTLFNGSAATVIGSTFSYYNFNACVRQAAFDCFGIGNDGSGILEYNATSTIRTGTTLLNGASGVAAWADSGGTTYALYPDYISGQWALVQFSNGTNTTGLLRPPALSYDRPAGMSVGFNRNIAISYTSGTAYVARTDGKVDAYALPLTSNAAPFGSYTVSTGDAPSSLYVDDANQTLFVGTLAGNLYAYALAGATVGSLRANTQFGSGAVNFIAEDPTTSLLYVSWGGVAGGPSNIAQLNRVSLAGAPGFITGQTHYGIVAGP